MGFGFNLIGFTFLLLATGGLVIYAIKKKTRKPLLIVAALWIMTLLLFIAATIADYYRTPIRLTTTDIIGDYRVDTNLFIGTNAKWQYNRFKFTITPRDSIIFHVTKADTTIRTYKEKIVYSSGPPVLWKVQGETLFHVIKYPPTLYRGYDKFYYVLKSDHYGNMFFRKDNN